VASADEETTRHVSFRVERYYCPKEVAALLGVTERTVRNWIASGKLKAYKLGPAPNAPVRIHGKSLKNFLKKIAVPATAKKPDDSLSDAKRRRPMKRQSYKK